MGMMRPRDLEVYKRAYAAAVKIHHASDTWPKHELYGGMADQIRRSSKGICANIAEGLAKYGAPEQRRFLNMALGSVEEVRVWLEFSATLGYCSPALVSELDSTYEEIGKMLGALMKKRGAPHQPPLDSPRIKEQADGFFEKRPRENGLKN